MCIRDRHQGSDGGAVFVGRETRHLFEHAGKVLRILESERIGDLRDRMRRIEHPFLGRLDQPELDMLLRRPAGFAFDQIAEIRCV